MTTATTTVDDGGDDTPNFHPDISSHHLNREQKRHPEAFALGVSDGARTIGIGTTKFRELIRSGELRSVRIGRRVVVPRSELDAYLDRLLANGVQS